MFRINFRTVPVLLVLSLSLVNFKLQDTDKTADVKFVIGSVEIQSRQQTTWRSAKINSEILEGDRIKTALNSRIEIDMPDGTVLKINENTIFDINEIKVPAVDDEDKMSFTVWAGNIWASFKKLVSTRQERKIESPSAVVAIRGTILEMDVDRSQNTLVRVEEGLVSVTSKDVEGEVTVSSNQETFVARGKSPTTPQSIRQDQSETDDASFTFDINASALIFTDPAVLAGGIPVSGKLVPGATLTAAGRPLTVSANGTFNGRVPVTEGLNTINFIATKGSKTRSREFKVFVNTKKPELRLSSPLVAGFNNRRDYSLSGGVFDMTPGDKVKVIINKEEVAEVLGRGSFNRTIILNEGENTINVSARDRSGNTTELSQRLFLDTVKPILTITEPARTSLFRDELPPPPPTRKRRLQQTVRGIVIDPEPSSGIKRMTINGKEIKLNSDGTFEVRIPLASGVNRLDFEVEDLAGNKNRDNSRSVDVSD